jgi:predicted permease
MSVDLGLQGYKQPDGEAFYRQMVNQVKSISGVQNAALATSLPLSLDVSTTGISMEGEPEVNGANTPEATFNSIGPGYFQTMGIPLVAGRDFSEDDKAESTKVVIVNETFTRKFCHGQPAVGKRFRSGGGSSDPSLYEIVGVAKDGKYFSLGEDPTPYVYFTLSQSYSSSCSLVVRTYGDPRSVIGAIRTEVQRQDPNLPVFNVKTLAEHMGLSLFPLRIGAGIAGAFGFLALILAAIGTYGVMSYSVSQRIREVGIRMALGANKGEVLRLMVKPGVILTVIGMAVGLIVAVGISILISGVLYGVSSTDPTTFVGIAVLLSVVAIVACLVPALRATKVDPMDALRCD